MKDEQNKLLKATICAILPYELKGQVPIEVFNGSYDIYDGSPEYDDMDVDVELNGINVGNDEIEVTPLNDNLIDTMMDYTYTIWDFVPYLRPLKDMTPDEESIWMQYKGKIATCSDDDLDDNIVALHNWYNKNHFDIYHLIEKGYALVAHKGMYNS